MVFCLEEISLEDKFHSMVNKLEEGNCWEWLGTFFNQGYGRFYHHSTTESKAHRISYTLHVGIIPVGLLVCHKCNNRWCVNPDHLYVGTNGDNMKDLANSGVLKGEGNASSKLKDKDVIRIRELYHEGNGNTYTLAKKYGVSQVLIAKVVKGTCWKHVSGPISKGNSLIIRLKVDEVVEIRNLFDIGESTIQIGAKFNRHQSTIERIVYGITHKNAGGPIAKIGDK